jgi:hypothetical protein
LTYVHVRKAGLALKEFQDNRYGRSQHRVIQDDLLRFGRQHREDSGYQDDRR